MYDTLTTSYTFSCPRPRRDPRAPVALPPARAAAGRGASGRLPRRVRRAAAATRIRASCTHDDLDWAPLGLDGSDAVPEPDDLSRRSRSASSSATSLQRASRRGSGRGRSSAGPRSVRARSSRRRFACSRRRRRATASGSRCGARRAGRSRSTSSAARTSTSRSSTTARWGWSSTCSRTTPPRPRRVPRRAVVGVFRRPAPGT